MILATKDQFTLRFSSADDMPSIDEITIACYQGIHDNWVEMHGKELYNHLKDPEANWKEKKMRQNHNLFSEHPNWVWVLERESEIVGFVTFQLKPDRGYGVIENNGVLPEFAGKGLGKFMYRNVLQYFRQQGLKYAFVETGLDDPHIPARKAYEGVGFDKKIPQIWYWQYLDENKPESIPDDT